MDKNKKITHSPGDKTSVQIFFWTVVTKLKYGKNVFTIS